MALALTTATLATAWADDSATVGCVDYADATGDATASLAGGATTDIRSVGMRTTPSTLTAILDVESFVVPRPFTELQIHIATQILIKKPDGTPATVLVEFEAAHSVDALAPVDDADTDATQRTAGTPVAWYVPHFAYAGVSGARIPASATYSPTQVAITVDRSDIAAVLDPKWDVTAAALADGVASATDIWADVKAGIGIRGSLIADSSPTDFAPAGFIPGTDGHPDVQHVSTPETFVLGSDQCAAPPPVATASTVHVQVPKEAVAGRISVAATLKDDGGRGLPGQLVKFAAGAAETTAFTNDDGVARSSILLASPGARPVTIEYAGDAAHLAASAETVIRVHPRWSPTGPPIRGCQVGTDPAGDAIPAGDTVPGSVTAPTSGKLSTNPTVDLTRVAAASTKTGLRFFLQVLNLDPTAARTPDRSYDVQFTVTYQPASPRTYTAVTGTFDAYVTQHDQAATGQAASLRDATIDQINQSSLVPHSLLPASSWAPPDNGVVNQATGMQVATLAPTFDLRHDTVSFDVPWTALDAPQQNKLDAFGQQLSNILVYSRSASYADPTRYGYSDRAGQGTGWTYVLGDNHCFWRLGVTRPAPAVAGSPVRLAVALRDSAGKPLAGAPLVVTVAHRRLAATTRRSGTALALIRGLKPGSYKVTVTFPGQVQGDQVTTITTCIVRPRSR